MRILILTICAYQRSASTAPPQHRYLCVGVTQIYDLVGERFMHDEDLPGVRLRRLPRRWNLDPLECVSVTNAARECHAFPVAETENRHRVALRTSQ